MLRKTIEMAFICKKCRKAFRKDLAQYEESDEFCPHCDNHYVSTAPPLSLALVSAGFSPFSLLLSVTGNLSLQVVEAKTPQAVLSVEGEDARVDNRMLRDDRVKYDPRKDFFFRRVAVQETERIDEGGWLQAIKDRAAGKLGPDGLPIDGAGPLGEDGKPLLDASALGGGMGRPPQWSKFNDDDLDWS